LSHPGSPALSPDAAVAAGPDSWYLAADADARTTWYLAPEMAKCEGWLGAGSWRRLTIGLAAFLLGIGPSSAI